MSNRNFDASIVTQRNKDKVLAQNIVRNQQNGVSIITNPQNSNGSWSVIPQVREGTFTTYDLSLTGYVTSNTGGTGNLSGAPVITTPVPPAPSGPPVIPAFIPTTWIDADGVDFSGSGRGVAYGNNKWIAVGFDDNATVKSSDDNGVTWTNTDNTMTSTSGNGSGVYGIATDGNGNWVAVGNKNLEAGAPTIIFSSDNGVTWAVSANGFNTSNGFSDRGWAVAYGGGVWMAVGHYNNVGIGYERTCKVATTFDPVTGPAWINKPGGTADTLVRFGTSNPGICLAYGNGRWCVGGQDLNNPSKGSIMYTNDNGNTWTMATGSFKGQCQGIATDGNGNWVAVGYMSTQSGRIDEKPIKYSSDNGATWTDTPTLSGNLFGAGSAVTYAPLSSGGIWIATGYSGSQTIIYSTNNGVSWNAAGSNRFTTGCYDVYFNVDRWVAVGNGSGSTIKYSLS